MTALKIVPGGQGWPKAVLYVMASYLPTIILNHLHLRNQGLFSDSTTSYPIRKPCYTAWNRRLRRPARHHFHSTSPPGRDRKPQLLSVSTATVQQRNCTLRSMTPRKLRQRHQKQPSGPTPLIQASDYESDAQFTDAHIPPPTRTNTELNLSVLRRHNPFIRTILSIAANAVVYIFTPSNQQWEKSGVEGTLFVCDQEPNNLIGEDNYCMIILNRRSLDNLIVDLGEMQDVEVTPELLIITSSEKGAETPKVMGIWIHKDRDDTRDINAGLIQQCWDKAKTSRQQRLNAVASFAVPGYGGLPALQPQPRLMGRQINLQDLFQQQQNIY